MENIRETIAKPGKVETGSLRGMDSNVWRSSIYQVKQAPKKSGLYMERLALKSKSGSYVEKKTDYKISAAKINNPDSLSVPGNNGSVIVGDIQTQGVESVKAQDIESVRIQIDVPITKEIEDLINQLNCMKNKLSESECDAAKANEVFVEAQKKLEACQIQLEEAKVNRMKAETIKEFKADVAEACHTSINQVEQKLQDKLCATIADFQQEEYQLRVEIEKKQSQLQNLSDQISQLFNDYGKAKEARKIAEDAFQTAHRAKQRHYKILENKRSEMSQLDSIGDTLLGRVCTSNDAENRILNQLRMVCPDILASSKEELQKEIHAMQHAIKIRNGEYSVKQERLDDEICKYTTIERALKAKRNEKDSLQAEIEKLEKTAIEVNHKILKHQEVLENH